MRLPLTIRIFDDCQTVILDADKKLIAVCTSGIGDSHANNAVQITGTINAAAALHSGWSVNPVSLYDEEGVEGWEWFAPDGAEFEIVGNHDDPPPWPPEATARLRVLLNPDEEK